MQYILSNIYASYTIGSFSHRKQIWPNVLFIWRNFSYWFFTGVLHYTLHDCVLGLNQMSVNLKNNGKNLPVLFSIFYTFFFVRSCFIIGNVFKNVDNRIENKLQKMYCSRKMVLHIFLPQVNSSYFKDLYIFFYWKTRAKYLSSSPKKWKFSFHYSLSCSSKTVWVSFFCWTQKRIFLKNVGKRTVSVPTDFHYMGKSTLEVNGVHQLFVFSHSSKYLLLCSVEERNSTLLKIKVLHDAIEEPFCLNGSIKNL